MLMFSLALAYPFAQALAEALDVTLSPHEERLFPDGECKLRPLVAYFSDRGRLFQSDRGRQNGVAEAALGKRAGTGLNVAQSSTISLKRAAVRRVSGVVLSPT